MSTQVPLQSVCPAPQRHEPPVQLLPPVQAMPQAPPQLVRPVPHAAPHTPTEHTWPAAHLVVQEPQCAASLVVSKHSPPQLVVPAAHEQEPAVQVLPPVHDNPHPPQLVSLLLV